MNTPKKKEVVRYFENAETISCVYTENEYKTIELSKPYYGKIFNECIYADLKDGTQMCLFDTKKGYAKILSYKKPKEKTYKITKEQIKQLKHNAFHENNQLVVADINNWFPEVFETKLEVGKWYKPCGENISKLFCFNGEYDHAKNPKGYGFISNGSFVETNNIGWSGEFTEATEQEVTEALTKECERLGIKEGVYIEKVVAEYNKGTIKKGYDRLQVSDELFEYDSELNYAYIGNLIVFNNGVFAKPIPTLTIQ